MNDYKNYICINSFFKEKKLIITDAKNRIISWKAFCNSCGGSAQICINSKEDKQLYKNVYAKLIELSANPESGIKQVYTSEETNRLFHLDNSFQFVLEAKDGYVFDNHICNQLVIPRTRLSNPHIANHGFLPTHPNMKTLLFAKGINIRNTHIQQATLVDIAPTISKIMNLSMKELDGNCLSSIIKYS
jgi:predicted AlkP superfamily pyrophosphatase or phosphodiesterase